MIRSTVAILAAFAALSTVACAGSSSGNDGAASTEAAATGHVKGHHELVVACEAANAKAGETAGSTMEMVEMESVFADCLTQANDAAVPVIEKLLKDNESGTVGGVKAALTAARKANDTLCEEEYKASENFGGSLQRVEAAGCAAEREHFLAQLIDDMVAFDGAEPTYIAADKAAHAECYKAYDATDAQSTAEMVQVNADLGECIDKAIATAVDAMAATQVENDEAAGPIATAKTRVAAAVQGKIEAASGLCGAVAEAGENGIGSLTRVSSAACTVRVREDAYKNIHVVPFEK